MKKLEIIIRPEKLSDLEKIMSQCGAKGMMITNIMGYGNQMGQVKQYRGTKYTASLVSKLKVETVVQDIIAKEVIRQVVEQLSTGNVGDGKIFVYDVEDAIRIRTGESKEAAL